VKYTNQRAPRSKRVALLQLLASKRQLNFEILLIARHHQQEKKEREIRNPRIGLLLIRSVDVQYKFGSKFN
jgi:histidinol phosphatase-like enzyme